MSLYFGLKNTNRKYIVVKHQLSGINTDILGIRYRDGFGVVAKDSKEHMNLKRVRMAVSEELPITFLTKIKSVINKKQIKAIWGSDIYRYFLQEEQKTADSPILANKEDKPFCSHENDGKRCGNKALKDFRHCKKHILEDDKIKPLTTDMKTMPKEDKKIYIDKVIAEARGE